MVLNTSKEKLKDFMSYYKRNKNDELFFVCINHPELLKYLDEFIKRSMN